MADSAVVDKGNPALVILLVVSFIVVGILGGAVYLWFHMQTHGPSYGNKKKKPMTEQQKKKERAKNTQMGD
ncbi:hypothetical protein T484DRAFT_1894101 [Baffinella frigidus]|nr:hypothetical protein T484DRAFT_1894101 [Cryptophyta sp. CCMP2293]